MSENALRDLNFIPGSERRNENSSKAIIAKPVVSNTNGNLEEGQKKNSVNGGEVVNSGAEVGSSEVEYIESENLNDVEDVDASLKVSFKNWDNFSFSIVGAWPSLGHSFYLMIIYRNSEFQWFVLT